ncbi:redoxin domain-containing protein [Paenibacillus xerothermodurans]|uniref:TlpA family protein disulfide reductase n=1 Tax=Paenibacillus xerothermodurans TaxID=1977292 RepID=A0A2W1N824_PAEXE|nr:redoxin domain-containing protein [Paenibacillus xerothermodurans]PZE19760.1 TlpA family protein disulfide reductase [Paenibacillus xerothermodurans]
MDTWTLGPLVIQQSMFIIVASILTGFGVLRLRQYHEPELAKGITGRTVEALLIGLVICKLSGVLFDPQSLRDDPRSLLYFHGGAKGIWLALVLMCGYVWYREHKSSHWPVYIDAWLIAILTGYPVYRILHHFLLEGSKVTDTIIIILCALVLIIRFVGQAAAGGRRTQQLFLAFIIGHMLITTVASHVWEKPLSKGVSQGLVTGIRVGQQAPDFALEDPAGTRVKLSDFRGQKVLVNFWATWCPPCKVEMPHMQRFYSEYQDREVVILSVNAAHTEASKIVVNSFIRYWGLTFPVVLDTLGDVGNTYGVAAYPATYVIDEHGIVRDKIQGAMNEQMLREAVK